jgi:hypothetical protein
VNDDHPEHRRRWRAGPAHFLATTASFPIRWTDPPGTKIGPRTAPETSLGRKKRLMIAVCAGTSTHAPAAGRPGVVRLRQPRSCYPKKTAVRGRPWADGRTDRTVRVGLVRRVGCTVRDGQAPVRAVLSGSRQWNPQCLRGNTRAVRCAARCGTSATGLAPTGDFRD